jgi:hypothetical protein
MYIVTVTLGEVFDIVTRIPSYERYIKRVIWKKIVVIFDIVIEKLFVRKINQRLILELFCSRR